MANILYAWEFGNNLGHVGAFMPLAEALRAHGHHVHWAVGQPAQVGEFLHAHGFDWLAAPVHPEQARPGVPLSYADILLRYGYADPKPLFGLVGAWRQLMQLCKADLVLVDHAPTALLAARTLGLPTMSFSYGFTLPPGHNPLPAMRNWIETPREQLAALDAAACASMNAVLARHGLAGFASCCDLFALDEPALLTFPELDHYPQRGPAHYWGALPAPGGGAAPTWPLAPGPRLFAYLRPETPHVSALLHALRQLGWPTLIVFPGMSTALRERCALPHITIADTLLDLNAVTAGADLAITYAPLTTTTGFLLGGKPVLLLPGHLEQYLLARRVAELGAGIGVEPEGPPPDFAALLRTLTEHGQYRQAAARFAARYAAFDQATVRHNLVRRIGELALPPDTPTDTPT
jgi:UDP:flavonoid glycosyltransferase YjiC (YdhE family)